MRIHRHRQNQAKINIPDYKVNKRIVSEELYVIGENNEQLGVMKTADVLAMAEERGLDVVEVSPKANPPVARLLNFKQFRYQKEKEIKKQRAQSKEVETKGVRLSLRIAEGDKQIRLNGAKKFLEKGQKVKVELILRGREKAHSDLAKEIVESFVAAIKETYPLRIEQPLKKQDGRVTMVVARE